MHQANFSVYLGHEDERSFIGFSAENGFFAALQVSEGLTKEKGREFLKKLSVEVEQAGITNLNDFDDFLAGQIKESDIPMGFSLAAGFVKGEVFLLKTVGEGVVYLKRGGQFAKLISGTSSASGYVSEDDYYIFTTKEFVQVFGSEDKLKNIFDHRNVHQLVESITPQLKTQDDAGVIALFVSFAQERTAAPEAQEQSFRRGVPEVGARRESRVLNFLANARSQLQTQDIKKRWTFVGVGIILLVFIWSVFLGVQRRTGAASRRNIQTTKELINEKLQQAEEVAFLNLPRATALINEAKTSYQQLQEAVNDPNNREIQEIGKLISAKEASILKKEDRAAEEFFDLSLENKNAAGQKLYLDAENLAILDPQGTAYVLSLEGKSLDRRDSAGAKDASLIAFAQDKVHVYRRGSGVYAIEPDGKTTKVIENDPEWKAIVDMSSYNGNLYLLDRDGDDVYKYLVAANGFSAKNSYFQGNQKPDLANSTSIGIDAFVYIGFPRGASKYVSGAQDNFNPSLPQDDSRLTKIFTSRDVEKVYGWDKAKGALYVIDKTGTYERQIDSSVLSKASDFVVLGTDAYVLVGSKIYRVSVE